MFSTDLFREKNRSFYPPEHIIWKSTYNITSIHDHGSQSTRDPIISAFLDQANLVQNFFVLKNFVSPVLMEGVHITPDYVAKLEYQVPYCIIPIFLSISDPEIHQNRFKMRGDKKEPSPMTTQP